MANISSVHSFMLCLSHNSWKPQDSAEEEHLYSLTGFLGNSVKKLYIAEGEKCVPTCAFQRLRCEAGSRLVQLDNLTRRNRTLTRLFQGTMQARLLTSARMCGQRWDETNAKLESINERLKVPYNSNNSNNANNSNTMFELLF